MANSVQIPTELQSQVAALHAKFERLKQARQKQPYIGYEERRDALAALLDVTRRRRDELADAISADFGTRSRALSQIAEVFVIVESLKYTRSKLKSWMKRERRDTSLAFQAGTSYVEYEALGVVGVMAPWNYPYQLILGPLISALAAGNRVLLKPSELTPATSEFLREVLEQTLGDDYVAVATGGVEVGRALARLPLDHILFIGSGRVGRQVLQAAAENLTPVTLELGGKSPALIHPDFPLTHAVDSIVAGKLFNAGQSCVAPDYLLLSEQQVDDFVRLFELATTKMYPTIMENDDYTSIINQHHYERVQALLSDAKSKGASIIEVNPAGEAMDVQRRKILPTLVLSSDERMSISEEEIFAPVLPIITYKRLEDAIAYINARPEPLAFYYFDSDAGRTRDVLRQTHAGGVTINDTILHFVQPSLPRGGVGRSGIGAYQGREGFLTFSHARAVFQQSRLNGVGLLYAPYRPKLERLLKFLIG